jgi:Ca2+-binding EF-hand superfamily protein
MKEYAYDENDDFEIVLEDFQRGISELFNLDDIDEMGEEEQYAVNQAIDDLFKLFDTEDKGMLDESQLRKGFRKFFPDPSEHHKKVIKKPLEITTAEQLFEEIDADGTGVLNEEKFMEYLKLYVQDADQLKEFSSQWALDADENRSGNINKFEFIKWRNTKGYLHFINVLEGKGVPFSLEDSPRSLEGRQSQRSSRPEMYHSKTMLSTENKDLLIHDIFTNKNKEGLSKAVKRLSQKKKNVDFSTFFKSIDFRAAIKDINTLAHNSGLYRINPLDLIRYLKIVLRNYGEGFEEDEFVDFMFKFTKQEKLTAYQRKIRESALRQIFVIIDVDGNKVADYTELSEWLVFLWGGSIEEKIESAFFLFDIDDTKTFSFDEFTDFLGIMFRIFLNFLSHHNPQYKELDYRELTEQTADRCFSDLQKSPAGEISHYELLYWVSGKKFLNDK